MERYDDLAFEQDEKATGQRGIYLQSLGAAGTVTGSKHLLLTPGMDIMIDCGLFQGIKALREKNWEKPPLDPAGVGALILTHAHLDHCGYIPLLVRNGYRNRIYMSGPTRDLAELILRDCAKLQEEDAAKANKLGYTRHKPAEALYTITDVEAALPLFHVCDIGSEIRLTDHLSFTLYPAGHILGACAVSLNCYGKTLVFSGDIGRKVSELLPPPAAMMKADYVIMESTYGDRLHTANDTGQELAMVINDTVFNKGNVLIPCFAVGRAQEVMHLIYRLKEQRQVSPLIPEYLDSPMAALAGKILQHYPEWLTIDKKECARMFSGVTINHDYKNTEKIIRRAGSKIIMAASGMLTGGRVLEYLKHYLGDANNTILLIGFQAEGTRGRALLNHAHEIKMHGRYYPVMAKVREIEGLSAHADQHELIAWLRQFQACRPRVFLVHGEPCAQEALRIKIKDDLNLPVCIVKQNQKEWLFTISPAD